MYGVLVDVSESMKTAYSQLGNAANDLQGDVRVERTHAVFTTLAKIAEREVTHHKRHDNIFACAFGLQERFQICDLIKFFEKLRDFNAWQTSGCGRDKLVELAKQHGAPHAEYWIREHVSEEVASLLTWQLVNGDETWIPRLLKKFPSKWKARAAKMKFRISAFAPFKQNSSVVQLVQPPAPQEVYVSIPMQELQNNVQQQHRPRGSVLLFSDDLLAEIKTNNFFIQKQNELSSSTPIAIVSPSSLSPSPSSSRPPLPPPSQPPSPSPSSPPLSMHSSPPSQRAPQLSSQLSSSSPPPSPQPSLRSSEEDAVKSSHAYAFIKEIISDLPVSFYDTLYEPIKPKPVQHVSRLMKELLARPETETAALAKQTLHEDIQKLIDQMAPFLYGETPMCMAMMESLYIFDQVSTETAKVLFILSDGRATDNDPLPIAQKLHDLSVYIVTCYLTSDDIENPKCLLDEPNPNWEDRKLDLFKMSSTMKNTHTPVSYLIDAGWELPPSGESRLFIEANSLNIVNELCETVVAHLTESCDALVDVLGKVPLATYINQANASFTPKDQQDEATCYAHAIAATFHLAMHRIVGREGGVPDFNTIRDRLIRDYGRHGAYTEQVLQAVCPEYRLNFQKIDETGARKAINKRQPVVARFQLFPKQWEKFRNFFSKTSKGILKKDDIQTNEPSGSETERGHAVVLIRCDPDCLTFMNSWGTDWADGGFFRVKDQSVLNETEFYDVYWTENDLTDNEKQAFTIESSKKAKEFMETFPSLKDIVYQCPKCNCNSKVAEYSGNLLEAECPRCHQAFKPTNKSILESLYTQNMHY